MFSSDDLKIDDVIVLDVKREIMSCKSELIYKKSLVFDVFHYKATIMISRRFALSCFLLALLLKSISGAKLLKMRKKIII